MMRSLLLVGCRVGWVLLLTMLALRAAALTTMPDWTLAQPNGTVRALVQSGNRIYVGGKFTSIGGVARNNLAALDAVTGRVDASWNPDVDNYVYSLTVAGERLYVGGVFNNVNGTASRHGLASFPLADGKTTATASAWDPKLPAFDSGVDRSGVYALASFGTKLYVGGVFDSINYNSGSGWFIPSTSVPRNGLAAVQLDDGVNTGTLDMAWNPNGTLTKMAAVTSFAVTPGYLYAYLAWGNDYPQGGQVVVALKHANGAGVGLQDPAWRPTLHVNDEMVNYDDIPSYGRTKLPPSFFSLSSLVIHGNKLYVGGNFDRVETTSRTALAALNLADGTSPAVVDAAWNPQLDYLHPAGGVRALAVADGRLIAGGSFTTQGAAAYNLIATFPLADGSNPGNVDVTWDPRIMGSRVMALMSSGGGVCVGGTFSSARGSAIRSLVGFGSSVPVTLGALSAE